MTTPVSSSTAAQLTTHYPASEAEAEQQHHHNHAQTPVHTETQTLVSAHSRSLPSASYLVEPRATDSPLSVSGSAPSSPLASFVSLSSIPASRSSEETSSTRALEQEELVRQSLRPTQTSTQTQAGYTARTLAHAATTQAPPLVIGSTSSLSLSSSSSSSHSSSLPSFPVYHPSLSSDRPGLDQVVSAILQTTQALVAPLSPLLAEIQNNASPDVAAASVAASLHQCAVIHHAGLVQLSQRFQEIDHPLNKRIMLSVGAASGQMKAGDSIGCVDTCQRAMTEVARWPELTAMSTKEAMTVIFQTFKQSFTSGSPLTVRLLYVEFFLTLSALLSADYQEWSAALLNSAQKGLRAPPNEAIKSMTKITKLLFTVGLNKPPSAYHIQKHHHHTHSQHSHKGSDANSSSSTESSDVWVDTSAKAAQDPRMLMIQQIFALLERDTPTVATPTPDQQTEEKKPSIEHELDWIDRNIIALVLGGVDAEKEVETAVSTTTLAALKEKLMQSAASGTAPPATLVDSLLQPLVRPRYNQKESRASIKAKSTLSRTTPHTPTVANSATTSPVTSRNPQPPQQASSTTTTPSKKSPGNKSSPSHSAPPSPAQQLRQSLQELINAQERDKSQHHPATAAYTETPQAWDAMAL